MHHLRWAAAIFVCAALAACGTPARQAPGTVPLAPVPPGPGSASNGESVYQADCMSCHGAGAKGGLPVGAVTSADIRWSTLSSMNPPYTDDLLRRAILQGLDQTGKPLDGTMPRWQGRLTTSQVDDLIAYLHTLP